MPARSSSRARSARSCVRPSIPIRVAYWPRRFTAPNEASGWKRFRERRPRSTRRRAIVLLRRVAGLRKPAASSNCRPTCRSGRTGWQDASWRNVRRSLRRSSPGRSISIASSGKLGRSGTSKAGPGNWSRHVRQLCIGSNSARRDGACRVRGEFPMRGEGLLVTLFVGLVAGWLAGKVVRGTGFGIIGDIIVGILGAFIAGWLFPRLGFHIGGGIVSEIIYSAIGAILLLLIVRLIRSGGRF